MRLIDADKLKAHYAWWGDYPDECPERAEEKKTFDVIVDLQPTVNAAPITRAKWIKTELGNYACPKCGGEPWYCRKIEYKFCPYCGARLFGEYADIRELIPLELAYLNETGKKMPEEEYERIKVTRTKEPVKQWRNAWEELTVAEK